uniref:PlxyGVORF97 protein n=1 Tax=Plutella xylostella granulovirus TaxID=98383 RepID=A0A1B2CSK6_9BBAC|nr:PlxyGVORF97 protein [Plutella xylostella granulovirus]
MYADKIRRLQVTKNEIIKIISQMLQASALGVDDKKIIRKLKDEYYKENGKFKGYKLSLIIDIYIIIRDYNFEKVFYDYDKSVTLGMRCLMQHDLFGEPIERVCRLKDPFIDIKLIKKPVMVEVNYYAAFNVKICQECYDCNSWEICVKGSSVKTNIINYKYEMYVSPLESFAFMFNNICELCFSNKVYKILYQC